MMTDSDIVRAWESGEGRGPAEQALALLTCGYPELSHAEMAELPIGERDALLLRLREQLLGSALRGYVECPICAEKLVFNLQCSQLRVGTPAPSGPLEFRCRDFVVRYRLPDNNDLVAAAEQLEVAAAKQELLARCLLSATRGAERVPVHALPVEVIAALSAEMAEQDPQGDLGLALRCAACTHSWEARFDISVFLWSEFGALSRRVFDEVAALSRAFGWSESEILAMSATRRRQYIQRVGL